MSEQQITRILGEWEGYQVGTVGRFEGGQKGPTAQVWFELVPIPGRPMFGNGCGQAAPEVHENTERWLRDLPILDAQTHLLVHCRRVLCSTCGPKLELLPWLSRYGRITRRLAESVARMCAVVPVKHVAAYFGPNRKTVKNAQKRYGMETLGPRERAVRWSVPTASPLAARCWRAKETQPR